MDRLNAGTSELQLGRLEREFAQDTFLALAERQRLLILAAANADLSRRIVTYEKRGQAYLRNVAEGRPNSNESAVLLLAAQEDFAAAQALGSLLHVTEFSSLSNPSDVENNIAGRVDRFLRNKGVEFDLLEKNLDAKIQEAHSRVHQLATSVVIIILSLVMFTFSDLCSRAERARFFSAVGLLAAFGATAFLLNSMFLWDSISYKSRRHRWCF